MQKEYEKRKASPHDLKLEEQQINLSKALDEGYGYVSFLSSI